jgi:hypothetical protein
MRFGLLFVVVLFAGTYSTSGPAQLPWRIRLATIPTVSVRLGLVFVHFLYDRWIDWPELATSPVVLGRGAR